MRTDVANSQEIGALEEQPNLSEAAKLKRCPPAFLITIDTEGDDLWSVPQHITTRNARFLGRFQSLCEQFYLKPTYLTNYEMATCDEFHEFGKDVLKRGVAEIGMHLHAWNSPPLTSLTDDDMRRQPYVIEYPEDIVRAKVRTMTALLEDRFGTKVTSHRAGRWALDSVYARILIEEGYEVDCSVTPHVSWLQCKGGRSGGVDYTRFPELAYFMDLEGISREGHSELLQVPVTIMIGRPAVEKLRAFFKSASLPRRILNRCSPPVMWLRPRIGNLSEMLNILGRALEEGRGYVEFMLHSSELMPGGSPNFPGQKEIELLYEDLEQLFSAASRLFCAETLTAYARRFAADRGRLAGTCA